MTQRLSKCLLLASVAFLYTLIALNNVTDYDSNYQFVRHVLAMDTASTGNRLMWRAITNPGLDTAFFWGIIGWEIVAGVLCWWAFGRMIKRLRAPAAIFARGKELAVVALTLGLLLWSVAFLCIGAEWFLMWESPTWNGQEAAFHLFACLMLVLLYVSLPDPDLVTNVEA